MTVVRERLIRCFAAVFPHIPVPVLSTASIQTVREWDSIAAVTLVVLLEEEFGVRITASDLSSLSSFTTIENYLLTHLTM